MSINCLVITLKPRSWRLGVDTTMRIDLIRQSDIRSRLPYIIPVAQPARHRDQSRKTPAFGDPRFGLRAALSLTRMFQ